MLRRFSVVACAAALFAAVACKDDTTIRASVPVFSDTLAAFPFSSAASNLPTALESLNGTVVPISGSTNFDVVFDVAGPNQVHIIPARQLISAIAGARTVAIATVTTPFDSLTAAPNVYYRPDTTTTVNVGQTVVMQLHRSSNADICLYLSDPKLYTKLVIDSVSATTGLIHFRQTLDPNCGYRSFLPGFPRN